jgi:hypothetical protein
VYQLREACRSLTNSMMQHSRSRTCKTRSRQHGKGRSTARQQHGNKAAPLSTPSKRAWARTLGGALAALGRQQAAGSRRQAASQTAKQPAKRQPALTCPALISMRSHV